jgi:hypothetical protein
MVLRDHVIEPKFVEQARLLSMPSPHHCRITLRSFSQQESPFTTSRKPFFDSIGQAETIQHVIISRHGSFLQPEYASRLECLRGNTVTAKGSAATQ